MNKLGKYAVATALHQQPATASVTPPRIQQGSQAESDRWIEILACERSLHPVDLDTPTAPPPSAPPPLPRPASRPKYSYYNAIVARHDQAKARNTSYTSFAE